jgi:hypothetical protein
LNKLTTLKAESFDDEDPEDLDLYGLEEPVWKIEVVLKPDQTKATLLVGSMHIAEGKNLLFAKRGERPAVVSLGLDLIGTITKDPQELREKKVIPFKTWEIKKAELEGKGLAVTLAKREGSKWWIEAPIEARADGTKMSAFLGALSRLEGDEFLEKPEGEGELAAYGLSDPLARVALYQEKPAAVEEEGVEEEPGHQLLGVVLLGKGAGPEDAYYAAVEGEGTLYRVKGSFFQDDFPEGLDVLRSKKVLDVSRYLVTGIEARGPEGPVVLERKEADWKVKKPSSGPAKGKDVNGLLSEVIGLEVDRFVEEVPEDLSAWGLDPAASAIALKKDDGEELGAVLISDKGPENEVGLFYVKAKGEPWVGLVEEAKRKALMDRLAVFQPEDD